jgi:hypothetical protein
MHRQDRHAHSGSHHPEAAPRGREAVISPRGLQRSPDCTATPASPLWKRDMEAPRGGTRG